MRTTSTLRADDRAVSDVVGYVLIFSLITLSVGVITVGGFSTLEDRQDAERINNAERAFDVFAGNVEDVYRGGAPSRATEMRLSGGTLRYGEPVNVTVRDRATPNINHTMELTPLIYADGDTEIIYAGGAVIRSEPEGSVMLQEPPFVLRSDRTVLPFVRTTRAGGQTSLTRDGTVRVETSRTNINATTRSGLSDASRLELVVESTHETAWEEYLESVAERDSDWSLVDDNVLEFETEAVSIPRFRVLLRLVD
jgi:hypothetical protein